MPPARTVEGEDAITKQWSKAFVAHSQAKIGKLGSQDRLYVLRLNSEDHRIAEDLQLDGVPILPMQFPDVLDKALFPMGSIKFEKGFDTKESARETTCRPAGPCLRLPAVSIPVDKKTKSGKEEASEDKEESRS